MKEAWSKTGKPTGQALLGLEVAKEETQTAKINIMATVPGKTVWPFVSNEEVSGSQLSISISSFHTLAVFIALGNREYFSKKFLLGTAQSLLL